MNGRSSLPLAWLPHHRRWIYCFVGRDEYERFRAVSTRLFQHRLCAEDVRLHCLCRELLHQWNMLVRRCVEDYLGGTYYGGIPDLHRRSLLEVVPLRV